MSTVSTGESILTLTEAAARQVRHLQEVEPQNAGRPLRIYVEKGGCSGLQYGLQFDERREGDRIAEWHGVTVVVDSFSADYLRGTMVDFKDGLNDSGFKISNPNAKQNCGCGNSFGV
jgi:iron-sulfur cluster assembly accessory protein